MAKQTIGLGSTANDGTGDDLRTAGDKINDNFDELYGETGWASYVDSRYNTGSPFSVTATTDTVIPNNASTIVEVQKPSDIDEFYFSGSIDVSGVSGVFVLDETITGGTSGATAVIKRIESGVLFYCNNSNTAFSTSETVTGGTSGATATVDALNTGIITGREGDGLGIMIYFKITPSASNANIDIWIDIGGGVGELYRDTIYFRTTDTKSVLYSLPSAYTLNTFETNGGTIYINSSVNCTIYGMNFNFVRTHKAR